MAQIVKKECTHWNFEYKGIFCEVVFWNKDYHKENKDVYWAGGIWNSYIYIKKDRHPELFKKHSLRLKNGRHSIFDVAIDMASGVTFYEKLYNERGKVYAIKIGNDYNHIWNGGEDKDMIISHLKDTVDSLTPPPHAK
jgi:hypothetical protein